jgi:hypothetical protein
LFTLASTRCDNAAWDSVAFETQAVANTTIARRRNVLALFQAYAEKTVAGGAAPKGLEQAYAATLQISPSMWSQIKSARPIGDKLARQIEVLSRKPVGWLDENHHADVLTPGEKAFLDLSLQAWRSADSAGRKVLKQTLRQVANEAPEDLGPSRNAPVDGRRPAQN